MGEKIKLYPQRTVATVMDPNKYHQKKFKADLIRELLSLVIIISKLSQKLVI